MFCNVFVSVKFLLSSLSACFFVCLSYFQLLSRHRSPALLHIHTHPISHICMARPCTYTLSINATTRPYSAHRHEGHTRTQARTRPLISYSFEHHTQRAALATHTHLWVLRFVTWNVNGAGSREKKLKIFSQLKKLQQTLFYYKRLIDLPQLQIIKTTEFPNVFQPAITLGKGG